MTIPSVSWDETSPAGSSNVSLGDNRIRELKTQIREVIGVDHQFSSSGQSATNGQHLQVTLQEQADLGTGAAGATILGSQTVGGKGELVYTDEDDNDVQITSAGKINAAAMGGVYAAANLAAVASIMNLVYPIGSVITLGVSTNPATLLGIGTWTAITGKVIVGKASSGTFDTLNATGGAETVDASHQHEAPVGNISNGMYITTAFGTGSSVAATSGIGGSTLSTSFTTSLTKSAGSSTQSTLQPYIVKYVWERTA